MSDAMARCAPLAALEFRRASDPEGSRGSLVAIALTLLVLELPPPDVAAWPALPRDWHASWAALGSAFGDLHQGGDFRDGRLKFGTWVYEEYGVKQAQEWFGHSDPATTLRPYVRLTTAARAKAVAGLDEVTRAALEAAEERILEDAQPARSNVVSLAGRRRQRGAGLSPGRPRRPCPTP